jgi:hypothetical protein
MKGTTLLEDHIVAKDEMKTACSGTKHSTQTMAIIHQNAALQDRI